MVICIKLKLLILKIMTSVKKKTYEEIFEVFCNFNLEKQACKSLHMFSLCASQKFNFLMISTIHRNISSLFLQLDSTKIILQEKYIKHLINFSFTDRVALTTQYFNVTILNYWNINQSATISAGWVS